MGSETYLKVPELLDTAKQLSQAMNEFSGGIETLKSALARDEGCWSDDKLGKGFEKSYVESKDKTIEGLDSISTSLTEFADKGLPNIVNGMQDLDTSYGDVLKQYQGQVEEYTSQLSKPTGSA